MFLSTVTVRFGECDGLGHVNNAMYYTYMEEARGEIFRLFNPSLKLGNWNLIVASTRCDYLHQVEYAEKLQIYTWIGRLGNSSFTVEHALANQQGEWVARGQAVLIGYDYQAEQSDPLQTDIQQILKSHMDAPDGAPLLRA